MDEGKELLARVRGLSPRARGRLMAELPARELEAFDADWPVWAHFGQEPPEGDDWRVWVMLAGRGFGKTRAGAEWVSGLARAQPGAKIALVAASVGEAREQLVEGPAGLIAVARPGAERKGLAWRPSLGLVRFASGAEARIFSGAKADKLRGPQHHFAWCDELAKWGQARDAWNNLMLGLRMGASPRALVTTTPRPIAALKAIIGEDDTIETGGTTRGNPHLSERHKAAMEARYAGTRIGRQELDGELLWEIEGALWEREKIEGMRCSRQSDTLTRRCGTVVVGVDPPASFEGTCGIVVCERDAEGHGIVLADHSVGGVSPEGWARKVAGAAEAWGAARVVAEANNGGRMVESVLKGAGIKVPVKLVHAADGKAARAAPISTMFEGGRAKFAGRFPALEDELCGLGWGGGYEGPGRSPDRADAMVWAMTELMLVPRRGAPAVRVL